MSSDAAGRGDIYCGARIKTVVLLAAAVPRLQCSAFPYPFYGPLSMSDEHVFYSRRDHALGRAFDIGQKIYDEPGQAVGRPAQELPEVGTPLGSWELQLDPPTGCH